jgi:hypothetical protein
MVVHYVAYFAVLIGTSLALYESAVLSGAALQAAQRRCVSERKATTNCVRSYSVNVWLPTAPAAGADSLSNRVVTTASEERRRGIDREKAHCFYLASLLIPEQID